MMNFDSQPNFFPKGKVFLGILSFLERGFS